VEGVDLRYPPAVLRRWSDALAAAGLFGVALHVLPDEHVPVARHANGAQGAERAGLIRLDPDLLFRHAELAVLATDHASALRALKELDTIQPRPGGPVSPPHPAVRMLTAVAQAQAGDAGGWDEVERAAAAMPRSPWSAWMVALGGVTVPHLTVPHLDAAGPAARFALEGGCRDPRLPLIAAAGLVADGDELTWEQCAEAVRLLERSRRVALPGEDAIGGALDLLRRAGLAERGRGLAAFAVSDSQIPREAHDAWRAAAKLQHLPVPRRLRIESLRPHRRLHSPISDSPMTCRCAGSTGWIGPERLTYVEHHLSLVDAAPVSGLSARLLRCRLTALRFLDLPSQELTLPVDRAG